MKRRKKRGGLIALFILILLIAAAAYIVHDSKTNLELTQFTVQSDKLPSAFKGFKIVQLSDLHGSRFEGRLIEQVRAQKPDIIVLTGDFITTGEDLAAVDEVTRELVKICDVYFVSGNHDFASGEIQALSDILERNGVRYLKDEFVPIERDGQRIILAGVEDPNSWADLEAPDEFVLRLRDAYPDDYVVFLGHRNYWMQEYPALDVDLVLCGHNHGGIIRLPYFGGVLGTDRTLFPEYDAGLFENDSYTMIVSRGLGNSVPIPRILNRPEIVSITLK